MITPSAPPSGTIDLGGDGVRFVLELITAFSVSRPIPPKNCCDVAPDERRTPGDVGVEALDAPVVQRQHVVLDRLDEEQPLQFVQLLADSPCARSCAWVQSVLVSYSSQTSSSKAGSSPSITQGVLWRVTAVQP